MSITQSICKEMSVNSKKLVTILAHAFIGWALCAATMRIGMATTSLQNTLIAHAISAPIYFSGLSLMYFKRYNYTSPLQTAMLFVGFVMAVDFFVVALMINRSLVMFASVLGTWLPFVLIFTSTYLTGLYLVKSASHSSARVM
jgi:hypothetical protein